MAIVGFKRSLSSAGTPKLSASNYFSFKARPLK